MVKVAEHPPSGTDHPHLHLKEPQVAILNKAGGLCINIGKHVSGLNPELAAKVDHLARELFDLAADKHQDLTKPF